MQKACIDLSIEAKRLVRVCQPVCQAIDVWCCMSTLYRSMDGLERSVRLGLVALAVSDMMFCLLYLATRLLPSIKVYYSPYDSLFSLYFQIYHEVWLTSVSKIVGSSSYLQIEGTVLRHGVRPTTYIFSVSPLRPLFTKRLLRTQSFALIHSTNRCDHLDSVCVAGYF